MLFFRNINHLYFFILKFSSLSLLFGELLRLFWTIQNGWVFFRGLLLLVEIWLVAWIWRYQYFILLCFFSLLYWIDLLFRCIFKSSILLNLFWKVHWPPCVLLLAMIIILNLLKTWRLRTRSIVIYSILWDWRFIVEVIK